MRKTKILLFLLGFLVLLMGISENVIDESNNQNISVVISDNLQHARVFFESIENYDLFIDLNRIGPNSIMGIEAIGLVKNEFSINSMLNNNDERILMESCTDWIGPIIVRSADNTINSESSQEFTGGWHTVTRNGLEVTTGSTKSVSYYIDGRFIENDTKTYGNSVEIIVTNLISGYDLIGLNNRGEIIKEIVSYKISKGAVNVSVTLEALSDLVIERYYGLQTQNSLWDKVTYINSDNFLDSTYATYADSCSGLKSDGEVVFTDYELTSNLLNLRVCLDTSFGLGNFGNLNSDLPYIFTKEYGKTYFNLINGKPVSLLKGQYVQWKGSYIIKFQN